jgi:hypothetical protein
MAETKKAMAIDANGDCYIIDEQVMKQHGKKIPDTMKAAGITGEFPREGEDWPVCSWKAHFDCHI